MQNVECRMQNEKCKKPHLKSINNNINVKILDKNCRISFLRY
jgi:hypothetical protein